MIDRSLKVLVQEQEVAIQEGNKSIYVGLAMQESALLRERAKDLEKPEEKALLCRAATEAMLRALKVSKTLDIPV